MYSVGGVLYKIIDNHFLMKCQQDIKRTWYTLQETDVHLSTTIDLLLRKLVSQYWQLEL